MIVFEWVQSFTETAKALRIPFEIVQKKINISSSEVMWQHEQFSRKKIVAGTLSHFSSSSPPFSHSHLFDTKWDDTFLFFFFSNSVICELFDSRIHFLFCYE
jgi:hypothetical protein